MSKINLGKIDGSLLREQRKFLLRQRYLLEKWNASGYDLSLLDGVINLIDHIADELHDKYGVDCLLTEEG